MNRKILFLMTITIAAIGTIDLTINRAYGFILNTERTRKNEDCSDKKDEMRTPVQESIDRAKCEKIAKYVGRIDLFKNGTSSISIPNAHSLREKFASGTATLIAPDVILTAAHIVIYCQKDPQNCTFTLGETTETISEVQIPHEHMKAYQISKDEAEYIKAIKSNNPDRTFNENEKEEMILRYYEDQKVSQNNNIRNLTKYDIALSRLTKNIVDKIDDNIKLINNNKQNELRNKIDKNKIENMWGVSDKNIVNNKNGSVINENVRHIAVIKVDKLDSNARTLSATYTIPTPYDSKCYLDDNGIAVSSVVRFEYSDKDPFLIGGTQHGDSGGPLIFLSNRVAYIAGVASGMDYTDCKHKDKFIAGNHYKNEWTSVNDHKGWIDSTLKNWGY